MNAHHWFDIVRNAPGLMMTMGREGAQEQHGSCCIVYQKTSMSSYSLIPHAPLGIRRSFLAADV